MASQIPRLSQRPQDRGWGLAGAGRLVSNVFQRSYTFVANLGGSLVPFFFTQNLPNPSVGLNDGPDDSVLKNRSLHVRDSKTSDLRLVTGLASEEARPEETSDKSQKMVTDHVDKQTILKNDRLENPDSETQKLLDTAVKTDAVALKEMKEPWWLVTGPSAEFIYFASDIPSTYRMVDGLVAAIQNQPTPTGDSGLGISSGASILSGYVAGCRGYVENREATKINDYWGKVSGKITMVRGAFETVGGAVFIPVRALSIAAAETSSKTVAQSALILGNVGSALFGVMYLLLAAPCAISMVKGIRFSSNLKKAMSDPELTTKRDQVKAGVDFVMEQFDLVRSDRKEIAKRVTEDPSIWDGENVKPIDISPEDEQLLSDYDKDYIKGFVGAVGKKNDYDEFTQAQIGEHVKHEFIMEKKRKQAELGRKAGSETVALVKEEISKPAEERLANRLLDPEDLTAVEDAESFLDKIKGNANFNIWFNAAIVFFCVLGAVAFFVGMAGSGGALGIAIAVICVVVSLGMLAIDGYSLWQAYKQGDPQFKDKAVMSLMGLFMTTSLILGTVFSGGLVPLIAAGVIGLMWAGFAGYSYYRWSKQPPKVDDKTDEIAQERLRKVREEEARRLLEQPKEKLA